MSSKAASRRAAKTTKRPVQQGVGTQKAGPGNPPEAYRWKPGQSGNPKGQPRHRINLWTWFCKYMAMTGKDRAKIDRTTLTAAQETALRMVERAVQGKGCGFERMSRYIVDREEGKAAEHIILDGGNTLTDEECDEVKVLIREQQANASDAQ